MSNLIKNSHYVPIEDKKKIKAMLNPIIRPKIESSMLDSSKEKHSNQNAALAEVEQMKEKIIKDAELFAQSQIEQALVQVASMKEQAEQDIANWWEEKRNQDEEHIKAATAEGFELGHREGFEQATDEVMEQHKLLIDDAKSLLEQAQFNKQQIIQEAEPFLLDLSCSISEKVIRHQLTVSPEWIIDLIRDALTRKREQGLITLCVNPELFSYVNDFREELALILDSQAELQILPDGNIKDQGCVIRSSMGSVDATVDTQLSEIKSALYHVALQNEGDAYDS